MEATRNMQDYHRLFWASQERYDKLVSLSSSGGAVGFRNGSATDAFNAALESTEASRSMRTNSDADWSARHVDSGIDVSALPRSRRGSCSAIGSSATELDGAKSETSHATEKQEGSSSPGVSRKHSPNSSRRHRKDSGRGGEDGAINGHGKISGEKPQHKSNHDKSPSKAAGEKSGSGRSGNEKPASTSNAGILGNAQAHTFAVPRPPQQRKGARRPLQLESLPVSKSSPAGVGLGGSGSAVVPPSPTVSTQAAVEFNSARRTQSR